MRWSAWIRRAATVSILAATQVAVSVTTVSPTAAAAAGPPSCPRAVVTSAATDLAAGRLARACDHRVESMAGRTPTTQVYANPDGTFTMEESLIPRFAKAADGTWVAADPTLRLRPDATLAPVAAEFGMVFSGGGAGPLVTMSQGTASLSMSWPGTLPKPVVDGDTATYPEVLPGVDLRVVASVDGFSHVLVIKSAAAGRNPVLNALDFRIRATGLTLSQTPQGTTVARDARGTQVFASATPLMWDSRGMTTGSAALTGPVGAATAVGVPGAGSSARVAAMTTSLRSGVLRLAPAPKMLTDPATVYPVYMDPPWSGGIASNDWTMVWSRSDTLNTSFWRNSTAELNGTTKGEIGSGRVCDSSSGGSCTSEQYIVRSLMIMSLSGLAGKHVLGANFTIKQGWSWTCSPASNAKLWYISGTISSSTTWNNQPTWNGSYTAQAAASHRYQGGASCSDVGNVEFNSTSIVQHALSLSQTTVTIGLRAVDESTVFQWKRWFHSTALMTATYNSLPTVGAQSTTPSSACVTGNGTTPAPNDPSINTGSPTLAAVVNDPDTETDLKGDFDWDSWSGTAWVHGGDAVDTIGRGNGTTSTVTVGLGNGTFRWRARTDDPWTYGSSSGTDVSAYTGWCEFSIDTTAPPVPTVASAEYPENCTTCGGVGTTGHFTISGGASDVAGYYWGFSDPPGTYVPAPTLGAPITVAFTPTVGGPYALFVMSKDTAGNTHARPAYQFTVPAAAGPVGRWLLADDQSSSTAIDDLTNGNDGTLVGGASFGADGRIYAGDTALSVDGSSSSYVDTPLVLDTQHSFSVSAWVKLGDKSTSYTALSQPGHNGISYALRYEAAGGGPTADRWVFAVGPTDTSCTGTCSGWMRATSTAAPAVNVWTLLTGVYDDSTGQMSLYVNGVAQGTPTTGVTTFAPVSGTRIGAGAGVGFHGSVADVQLWNRVLFDTEVRGMVYPPESVGVWDFEQVNGLAATDSSGRGHDLDMQGDASIPASGAGHDGNGLLLMDGAGSADAESPVLFTDQPFTVSAWALLADGTADRTLISQDGSQSSAFALMYDAANGGHWTMRMYGSDTATPTATSATATATAARNTWTYLTGVYDPFASQIRLYVNSALAATATFSGAFSAGGEFTIGRGLAAGAPAAYWIGDVDQAHVYAGVFPQLAGDWRFEQCTGSPVTCTDAATNPHSMVLDSTGVSVTATGHDGAGLAFTGTGSGATAGGPPVSSTSSLTVSAWVYPTGASGSHTAICLVSTNNCAFQLGYDASGKWYFKATYTDKADDASGAIASGSVAALNTWTHVAGVYDMQAGQIYLYVNGTLATSAPFTSPWPATGGLAVGSDRTLGVLGGYWVGTIDEVRAYQGVLSDISFLM